MWRTWSHVLKFKQLIEAGVEANYCTWTNLNSFVEDEGNVLKLKISSFTKVGASCRTWRLVKVLQWNHVIKVAVTASHCIWSLIVEKLKLGHYECWSGSQHIEVGSLWMLTLNLANYLIMNVEVAHCWSWSWLIMNVSSLLKLKLAHYWSWIWSCTFTFPPALCSSSSGGGGGGCFTTTAGWSTLCRKEGRK